MNSAPEVVFYTNSQRVNDLWYIAVGIQACNVITRKDF